MYSVGGNTGKEPGGLDGLDELATMLLRANRLETRTYRVISEALAGHPSREGRLLSEWFAELSKREADEDAALFRLRQFVLFSATSRSASRSR